MKLDLGFFAILFINSKQEGGGGGVIGDGNIQFFCIIRGYILAKCIYYCDVSQEEKNLLLQVDFSKCKKDETLLKQIVQLEFDCNKRFSAIPGHSFYQGYTVSTFKRQLFRLLFTSTFEVITGFTVELKCNISLRDQHLFLPSDARQAPELSNTKILDGVKVKVTLSSIFTTLPQRGALSKKL